MRSHHLFCFALKVLGDGGEARNCLPDLAGVRLLQEVLHPPGLAQLGRQLPVRLVDLLHPLLVKVLVFAKKLFGLLVKLSVGLDTAG